MSQSSSVQEYAKSSQNCLREQWSGNAFFGPLLLTALKRVLCHNLTLEHGKHAMHPPSDKKLTLTSSDRTKSRTRVAGSGVIGSRISHSSEPTAHAHVQQGVPPPESSRRMSSHMTDLQRCLPNHSLTPPFPAPEIEDRHVRLGSLLRDHPEHRVMQGADPQVSCGGGSSK